MPLSTYHGYVPVWDEKDFNACSERTPEYRSSGMTKAAITHYNRRSGFDHTVREDVTMSEAVDFI